MKVGKKTPQLKIRQKTRAKYECPARLAEMINQANVLPKDFHFSFEKLLEMQEPGYPFTLSIAEFLLSLPDNVQSFVFGSEEHREYEKDDSREFWINNDGYAQDVLIDLNAGNEISDEVFNEVINSDAHEIADLLVEHGYYGDDYSYSKQREREREESSDHYFGVSFEHKEESETERFFQLGSYLRALERLQDTKNFLLAIINLGKNFEEVCRVSILPAL